MADRTSRLPQNVDGSYYVDGECIGCTECVELAGDLFGFDETAELAFVKKQPQGEDEAKLAKEAMNHCPVDAIGDDG